MLMLKTETKDKYLDTLKIVLSVQLEYKLVIHTKGLMKTHQDEICKCY